MSKGLYTIKTLFGVFRKCFENHLLDFWQDSWNFLAQRRYRSKQVLRAQLYKRAVERAITAQPFIDDYAKRILVTGRPCFSLYMFRGHIWRGSCHTLSPLIARTLCYKGNSKIT